MLLWTSTRSSDKRVHSQNNPVLEVRQHTELLSTHLVLHAHTWGMISMLPLQLYQLQLLQLHAVHAVMPIAANIVVAVSSGCQCFTANIM